MCRKMTALNKSKAEEQEKEKRLDKLRATVHVAVKSDSSRLLAPTQAVLNRQNSENDLVGERINGTDHQARFVPNWRKD